jgi:sucrose-6-phosphate hydrolase SacC (GH32 family)
VTYDVKKQELAFIGGTRHLAPREGRIGLQLILDIASVDIFADDGRIYAPINHLGRVDQRGITMKVEGGNARLVKAALFELKSMWEQERTNQ